MAASPSFFAYKSLAGIEKFAKPGARGVVAMWLIDDPRVKAAALAGCEILIYQGFVESDSGSPESARFYSARPVPAAFRWQPARSNWPDTFMMDVRAGSAWGQHHVGTYVPGLIARRPWLAGAFYDVYGERLWSAVWAAMTPLERTQWAAGMLSWSAPIRAAWGDRVLICNGTWNGGNLAFNGGCVENHPLSELGSWRTYLDPVAKKWRRNEGMVICKTLADAKVWATVPGVTHVALQGASDAYAAPGEVWGPFSTTSPPPVVVPPSALALPGIPDNLRVEPGDGTLRVSFDPRPAAELVDKYRLYLNDVEMDVPADGVLRGLTNGQLYLLRVSAHNASPLNGGHGKWTAVPVPGTPAAPVIVPPPPPSSDPCADVRDALAQTAAHLVATTAQLAAMTTARDAALAESSTNAATTAERQSRLDAIAVIAKGAPA